MFVFNFLRYVCSVLCQVTVISILIPIPNPHTINSLTYGEIAKKDQKKMKIFRNVKKIVYPKSCCKKLPVWE